MLSKKSYKILYIQHAGSLGGSSMSLLYTMQGMCNLGHTCVVALARPSTAIEKLYIDAGFETLSWPDLILWDHSTVAPSPAWDPRTWQMLSNVLWRWKGTKHRTLQLVQEVKPDIIHLNSMPFVASAHALIRTGIPFVWHVREPPFNQGLRTILIRHVMLRAPALIFISDHDRKRWLHGVTSEHDRRTLGPKGKGVVIPNFVDFKRFDRNMNPAVIRSELNIPVDAKVILFFGGTSRLKGAHILLSALDIAAKDCQNLWAIFAGAIRPMSQSLIARAGRVVLPLLGKPTERQDFYRRLGRNRLRDRIVLLPFRHDPERLIAASDLVVFPSTEPHFARPVIEAGAMAKPVVASKIGGVEELVEDGVTGFLVQPNEPNALADAIVRVIGDKWLAANMGEAGYKRALANYNADINAAKIMSIYERLLGL